MKKFRVCIAEPDNFSLEAVARLVAAGGAVDCRALCQKDVRAALEEYDVFWLRLGLQVREKDLPANLRCRWVVSATTGTDHLDLFVLAGRGVRVLCLREEKAFLETIGVTAELTLGLVIALARRLPAAVDSVARQGRWDRDAFRGVELYGKTAGIVGLGRLGRKMANYLGTLGMEIIAWDPYVSPPSAGVSLSRSLDDLLGEAHVVTVHVPLNDETMNMFHAGRFSAMRSGAFFVNTSRGGLVDEAALLAALVSGHLGGAALDVLCGEPAIGLHHPLVAYAGIHDNLIITPHIGGAVEGVMARCEEFMTGVLLDSLAREGDEKKEREAENG